ncbi:hypothetical protein FF80_01789 [Devosia sp. LC5]|nr:hypothetical protein [Devosia sp. LC5]KFC68834.1 hypothetical protein FF80_01789 [Devosia sp. LC5]
MSNLILLLRRLTSWLTPRDGTQTHPDQMSLQEWADLPAYHPLADRAPC